MKRNMILLSVCLAVLLAVCLMALPTEAEAATSGKYTYSVSGGKATITECDTSISGNVTIPSTLGGYPVTEIGDYAFTYCSSMTGVTIPSGVTSIGSDAFYGCSGLTSVSIPSTVTYIFDYAFYGCSNLTAVNIPNSVTWIGNYAFYNCYELKTVTIGNSLEEIGAGVFKNCVLTEVTLPSTLKKIGAEAFDYTKLANVYFDGTATQWANVTVSSNNSYLSKAVISCATTVPASNYPESAHNYANNLNESKTFTWSGAKRLAITFNSSTFVENNYDFIYVYNSAGTQLAKYTGSAAAGKTLQIPGNSFTIKLTSDSSAQKYGYAFTSIVAYMPLSSAPAHSNHPLCGSKCGCSGSTHSSQTWTAWDGTTKMYNGYYYLTKDIVLDSTMILDYSYTSYLCLNGHTITCSDTVFYIYSYRSLLISDCVGTGTIKSTGTSATIRNNKYLSVWGGTIVNSGSSYMSAIEAYSGTTTYINNGTVQGVNNNHGIVAWGGSTVYVKGGTVTAQNSQGIYLDVGSKVYIQGGTVHGKYSATSGTGGSGTPSQMTVSGGRVTSDYTYGSALDVGSGDLTITGGYIAGLSAWNEGTTTISGGTISGVTNLNSRNLSITGGTFSGNWSIWPDASSGTSSTVISGGNFDNCTLSITEGDVWVCGGSFSQIAVFEEGKLYLSGVPEIAELYLYKPGTVSAQNPDGTGSFGGDPVTVYLCSLSSSFSWKDGHVVASNVKSDAVASRFVLPEEDEREQRSLSRSGNNLVLRVLPHGTWGSNIDWYIKNGTLYISGTGAITETYSGNEYPWGDYWAQITAIVVEPGITEIPYYTFEYGVNVTTITLPETLTYLALNAFNDCSKLNNLLLPASLQEIDGSSNTGYPAFIRCGSLTDVYYLGTREEWNAIPRASRVDSHNSTMTMHFLQLYGADATCTQPGVQKHYRFDDVSVYGVLYDINRNPIQQVQTTPPLEHSFTNYKSDGNATCTADGTKTATCDRCPETDTLPDVDSQLGHSFTDYKADGNATCTADGTKTATCDRCTETDTLPDTGSQLGHSFTDYKADGNATCTADGTKTATCDRCTETDTQPDVGSQLGHSFTDYKPDGNATCTADGTKTATCDRCTETNTLPDVDSQLGHSFTNYNSDGNATCTADGTKTATCDRCTVTDTLPDVDSQLGHSFTSYNSDGNATCTADGTKTATCDRCIETDTLPDVDSQLGHSFTNYNSDGNATCTADGTKTATCDRCTETDTLPDAGSQLGHSFTNYNSDSNATCTADGTRTATCDRCPETDTQPDVGSQLGHSFTDYKPDGNATCTADGTKTATCDRCTETNTLPDVDSQLGHSFTNYNSDGNATCTADGTKTATCDRCTETDTLPDADSQLGHSFTDYTADGNATCTADGTKTATCDRCTETDTLPDVDSQLGHSFTDYKPDGNATCTADGTKTATCDRCPETDTLPDPGSRIPLEQAWQVDGNQRTLLMDIDCDVTITEDTVLNLNGFNITGTVTVADGCTLYMRDSATDDFTVLDGHGYGKLTDVVCQGSGQLLGAPEDVAAGQDGYLMIREADGISFHRIQLRLHSIALRPSCAGLYFNSAFAGDEKVAAQVAAFGVALNARHIPNADNMDSTSLYSRFAGDRFASGTQVTSTLLTDIMTVTHTDATNRNNANRTVSARPYILLKDGTYLFGGLGQRSLRQQVEMIDPLWDGLTQEQQAGLAQMFTRFASVMRHWNIPTVAQYGQKETLLG